MYTQWLRQAGIIWTGILWSFLSYGQSAPVGSLPMQYVGSFAGEAGVPRLSSSFSYQNHNNFNGRQDVYESYLSYDQFIPAIRSGIGITTGVGNNLNAVGYNNQWTPIYFNKSNLYYISGVLAPKFSIQGKYTISPSIDYSYQGNSALSGYYSRQCRVGMLFNTKKYYIGYSVYLLNNYAFKDTNNINTKVRGSERGHLQLGYTFQPSSESKFSCTPQMAILVYENYYDQVVRVGIPALMLNFRYSHLLMGINNRGWHFGWQTDKVRAMASASFGNEKFFGNLSFRYLIKNQQGNKSTPFY
ncbi:MAG: type IX secretion system membrane protein PorP/SprF [Bacteroidota bacterium]